MLSHVDEKNNPTMVDIGQKKSTWRRAEAKSFIQLPEILRPHLLDNEIRSKKGPVFQTAIIAATMAAKKTSDLIPFCHPLPLESININISVDESLKVTVTAQVKTFYKTGVEMEALTAATIASLTIYDMLKALSTDIVIEKTFLTQKTGGKKVLLDRPLKGLVLTGGKSQRMQKDKALISYKGLPHAEYIYNLLSPYCDEVYLSARKDQWQGTSLARLPTILDDPSYAGGPMAGLIAAFKHDPHAHWFVLACDLVHVDDHTIQTLLGEFDTNSVATAFKNSEKGFPEALCALYTPAALDIFISAYDHGITCPVKTLKNTNCLLVEQTAPINLANINTIEEYNEIHSH